MDICRALTRELDVYRTLPGTSVACVQWPSVQATIRPPHGGLKLFGGAAFERCLSEFQEAAHALRFPSGVLQATAQGLLSQEGPLGDISHRRVVVMQSQGALCQTVLDSAAVVLWEHHGLVPSWTAFNIDISYLHCLCLVRTFNDLPSLNIRDAVVHCLA